MPHADALRIDNARYDMVRAIVCAFCWQDQNTLLPVSTLAVQYELRRRNQELPAKNVLQELNDVRDVQRIEGGYWLPAPTHLVTSQDVGLVVSGLPTQELKTKFDLDTKSVGASRLVIGNELEHVAIPKLPWAEWLGSPLSTKIWAEELLRSVRYSDPYGMDSIEVFRHWKMSSTERWLSFDSAVIPDEQIVLARHQSRDRRSNYYLLRVRGRNILAAHELTINTDDIVRLMCGLRAIGGDPLICRVTSEPDARLVSLSVGMLPRAEQCLLMAVGQLVAVDR